MALSDDYLRGSGAYDYAVKRDHYSGPAFGARPGHRIGEVTWVERHPVAAELIRAIASFAVLAAVAGLGLFIICTGGVHG